MTWTKEVDGAEMDAAADTAAAALKNLLKEITPEQRKGAMILLTWINNFYLKAGYKRLMRVLREQFR